VVRGVKFAIHAITVGVLSMFELNPESSAHASVVEQLF